MRKRRSSFERKCSTASRLTTCERWTRRKRCDGETVVGGCEDDLGRGAHPSSDFEGARLGKADVEEEQVGSQLGGHLHRLIAIRGFAHETHPIHVFQENHHHSL